MKKMITLFYSINNKKKKNSEKDEEESLEKEFEDVFNYLDNSATQPDDRIIDNILSFSKAHKALKLGSSYTDLILN